ncbi:unnamed protein product [Gordionus sp. m RMFG-2023]|uniref:N-acetyl-D-glucosamine kinase-like n=1 Tax=Gordionus sp. m RMFG-2023 TaxID=3053472 RepID=UPI0030E0A343
MSEAKTCLLIGGIEGGSTQSTCIIINQNGEVLSKVIGPSTNPWLFKSDDDWAKVIKDLVDSCKKSLICSSQEFEGSRVTLDTLGISMSGSEADHVTKLERLLMDSYDESEMAKHVSINHDTDGSIFTASNEGGIVLIGGTGSAAQLYYPPEAGLVGDLDKFRIGGWGYLLGDEGSAYWVSLKAIKTIYNHNDKLVTCFYSTQKVETLMNHYFKIQHPDDILKYFYKNFDKSFVAKFCLEIVRGANNRDPLCLHLLKNAGKELAKHVLALLRKADLRRFGKQPEIKVICVGSMWNNWEYMKEGLIETLNTFTHPTPKENPDLVKADENGLDFNHSDINDANNGKLKNGIDSDPLSLPVLSFFCLRETAAIGAAYSSALSRLNRKIPIDYAKTTQFLYTHYF